MRSFHRAAAAIACLALAATVFRMPVKAQEEQRTEWSDAMRAGVTETVAGGVSSDTLSAVNDGLRWPDRPHSGGGENPYAWTNYKAALMYPDRTSSLRFDFPFETEVAQIAIYYFVDSWSASLPKNVEFVMTQADGMAAPYMISYNEPVQINSTCWRQNYRLTEPVDVVSVEAIFENAEGQKHRNINKCVGIYEFELYNRNGSPIVSEPEGQDIIFSNKNGAYPFYEVLAGSEEILHGKFVDNAFDGDPETLWHTDWNGCAEDERYVQMELGRYATVKGLRYLPRNGKKSGDNNGRIAKYQIYTAYGPEMDEYGDILDPMNPRLVWTLVAEGEWNDTADWKEVRFEPVPYTRYVKLVAVDTYGVQRNQWVSAAEIEIIGSMEDYYYNY